MPDFELIAAAEMGTLNSATGVEQQARRMLSSPRAKTGFREFYRQWLRLARLQGINKSVQTFPDFTPAVADALKEETLAYTDEIMRSNETLATLLTGSFTFTNDLLAKFYGETKLIPGTTSFVRTPLDPTRRAGVLTLGAFLAINAKTSETSPTQRGKSIRQDVMCQQLPAPPANVPNLIEQAPPPPYTTRQLYEKVIPSSNPVCWTCHRLTDSVGFAFERFDAVGRWRVTEKGLPIDDSGEMVDSNIGRITGAVDLAKKLSGDAAVQQCAVKKWYQFALGRPLDGTADRCPIDALAAQFTARGDSLRELVIAIILSEPFGTRQRPTVSSSTLKFAKIIPLNVAGITGQALIDQKRRWIADGALKAFEAVAAKIEGEDLPRFQSYIEIYQALAK